jgi:hypothetical protein
MYQEAPDEFFGGHSHQTLLVTMSVISPTKRHLVAIERDQAVI